MDFITLQRAKLHYVFENIFHVVERLVSKKEAKMNKIFKVIWSKSKQCYVVVSELAKNTTGKKKIIVASIFAAMVAGQTMQVEAGGSFTGHSDIQGIAISAGGGSTASAGGANSIAIGKANANDNGAVAIGSGAQSGGSSVSMGVNAKAKWKNTVALGVETNNDNSINNNYASVSVGVATRARTAGSIAMGVSADASGKYSLALGSGDVGTDYTAGTNYPRASGEKSIAIGHNSNASEESAIAIGSSSISDKTSAIALGRNTNAKGENSSAIGAYSIASATDATALGRNANATEKQSTALGTYSKASGEYSTGVGFQANASGSNSTAVGVSAKANKDGASAMGAGARAYGSGAISLGYQALSGANIFNSTNSKFDDSSTDIANYAKWGDAAIGLRAIASGGNATALGRSATATAANAIAIGGGNGDSATDNTEKTEATGEKSTAIGYNAKAKTGNDLAVGRGVTSSGGAATALGYYATASGNQTVALGSTINSTAQYATGIGYSVNSQGEGSVAIGAGTDALGSMPAKKVQATAKNAIAIGRATQATGESATAIGTDATASSSDAVAIGRLSNASGGTSISFGYNTKATHTNAVAIGTDVSATEESAIALGRKTKASALNATAVGPLAEASENSASAFGMSATASEENALALGTYANATRKNSVSLGSNSSTVNAATSESSVTFGNKNITWTAGVLSGTNLDGMQVSVGATGAERQIKNVAAGKISATSTDAINGAQLYAVAEGLRTKYVSINSTIGNNQNNDGATGSDSVAIGPDAAATKADSVAMGRSVKANGQQSIAVGKSAEAKQDYNVAIGSEVVANGNNSVAMGRYASSTGTAALAIGAYGNNKSTASGNYSIAIGRDVTASGVDSIATGRDSKATAEKALAYGANAQALATNSIAIGADSQANVDKGIAIGAGSKANVASGVAGYNPNTETIVRTDTYTPTAANTWSGTWGAASVGDGTNTRQITGVAAGKADTDAVNVAQLKSVNLAFTGNSGNGGDVNLSNSKLAVEGGTNSFITTTAANKKLEIKTTQGTLQNTSGTVSVNGANGLAVAQNVADVINQANADRTITYKANGTGNNSVKLSDGLNFKNGITTTATVGANGQVSFDLNSATQKSITDSATAVARTISLGGDTGTTTAKSLSSSNVNFGIKSGSPTYLTTKATGDDVTLTINEQAIKDAAKDASSFKVKANSTAAENVKGGDTVAFNNGDNIAITQTGKTFKIATAKNVTFDTATIGTNTTIGSTGVSTNKVTVGNISIDGTDGINAGGKIITNVGTGRVSNSSTDDGNVANIGDVKAIANNAVANLSTELGITDGTTSGTSTVNLKTEKLKVVGTGVAKATVNGQTITVDVAKGTLTNNTTTGALTGTAGVVDANDMATAVNTAITKAVDTATGIQKLDISAGGTDSSVNLKTQKLTVAGTGAATASLTGQTITVDVAQGTFTNKSDGTTSATAGVAKATDVAAAINNTNSVLGNKITAATQSLSTLGDNKFKLTADSNSTTGQALNKSGGLSFKIAGDGDLVSTSATTDTVNVTVKKGTLSTNTDGTINKTADGVVTADNMKTVVNDAITKAVTSAKDGSAWNISTNGGTATKVSGGNTVDLKGGDNIVVEQDPTDGKKITVKTKKDLTLDSVTATNTVKVGSSTNLITLDGTSGAVNANTFTGTTFTGTTFTAGAASMNATGFHLTGGPSVTTTGIDAGSAAITNVASGGTTGTNAANINDVKQIAKDTVTNAVSNLSSTLTVTDGTTDGNVSLKTDKLKVVGTGAATANVNGQTITIGVAKGTLTNDTDGKVKSTGTGVATTDEVESTVNNAISKAVTNSTAAVNTLGANTLTLTADSNSTTGQALNQSGGLSFKVAGDGTFISTSATGDTVTVSVKQGVFGSNADGTAKSTTNGVATTDNVADIVNTTVSNAVNNVTSNQNLKIGGDTTAANSAVNLKNDTLSVKGDNKYISTAASGKDITLTVNEQAIKDAAKDASSFKVKANSTAAEDVKGGDTVTFNDGDNIAITQTGKTFKIATAKNVTFDTATIGTNTTIGSTGITTNKVAVGNISIDGTDGINAGGKTITNVGTGRVVNSNADDTNVANIGDVKAIATDAVANLSTNLGITDGTTSGAVNLKNQSLKVVGTGAAKATVNGQTITVDVAKGTLTNNTTTGALTGTTGVVDANDMATAVNTAITKAVDNATGTQALNLTDGTNTGSVKLSTQTLSVSGTNGVQATVGGQGITIGLDTATKNLISNSSTAVDTLGKNTFTLKADSTDTTAQALNKSGGLAFKVAGDGDLVSTSATTDTVNVTVKKGTLSTNTDGTINKTADGVVTADNMKTVVNDAITKAVTSAKDGSAWNISTNGGTATKVSGGNTVDLKGGDNIVVEQDPTDGKKITVKTKKDLTLDSVTAANTVKVGSGTNLITLDGTSGAVSANTFTGTTFTGTTFTAGAASMNATGFRLTGGPSVTTTGIDAGSAVITNVASGGTTGTNAANIDDVKSAISDLTTNLTKNTSISYTANTATPGQTVSLKDGFNFSNGTLTTAEVAAGGVVKFNVTQGSLSTDGNGNITNTAGVATTDDVKTAVNTAITKAVDNATGTQKLDISAGGTDSSVNLKTQKLTVAGTGAATASLNNQTITVNVAEGTFTNKSDGTTIATAGVAKATDVAAAINNANTVLGNKITAATQSLSTLGDNKFKLTADSTSTTGQALNKSGGLSFKIAGDGALVSTKATTADTIQVSVKKGTLSTNTDGTINKAVDGVVTADNMTTVVNDAITKAVTSAKDGSAWNISTNGGTATKVSGGNTVDLNGGDNIEITQDPTDGKKITVKTKKDLTLDSVTAANTVKVGSGSNLITLDGATGGVSGNTFTAGNASMNTTGFRLTGGPSVTTTGIDAGNAVITNVASGGTTSTNAANIGDITKAISDLTTNLTKNTSISYTANNDTPVKTVSLKDGFKFTDGTLTTATVEDGGVVKFNVTQGSLSTDSNGNITNTAGVATTDDVKNAVSTAINTAVTKATGAQVLNITDGNNNGSINLKNDALKVVGTDGVTTEVNGKTITVGLDTATKDKINNASVATNKNISLAADTGNASSQSLKDGDVSFAVKGATGDYISTNMNGSTVEISTKRATINSNAATGEASVTGNDGLATAKNVANAINAATAKAVSQSAWKLAADGTTGTETISGGDTVNFKAGSNMEVSRTGKDITYKTKDNVAFTTVTAGTGANEVKLDGNTGMVTAKDITAAGDVTAKNVTTSGNVTAAGTVKGDTVQGNTVKAGNVTITGGTTNTITGLSNTTWTPAGGIQTDRAATEGQLQQAINQVNTAVGNTALTFKGDSNPAQSMTLQGNTFAITGDTMIKTTTNTNGIGLSLDTSKVNIAYAANGLNGQTTSLASGFNFSDGDHTKATVDSNGVVKYDAKTSTISVANGHATSSGNDLATADNVADAINQMTQNNSGNTTQLRQEISKVATETHRVGAHAAAMAALKPIQYDPLAPTQIMAGVGNYRGESAAALGIAHYTNDNTMFNVGVSVGGNHNMINAGVTHKFGISAEKKNIPDRYKAGPISSIYVMQDEMTQLRSENEAYKAKLDKQQSEIDALKAAVDQLLASKA